MCGFFGTRGLLFPGLYTPDIDLSSRIPDSKINAQSMHIKRHNIITNAIEKH